MAFFAGLGAVLLLSAYVLAPNTLAESRPAVG
jgi:hypothetical protein